MRKKFPAEIRTEARRLRAEGYYVTEIAKRLAVSESTVSAWTRDIGLRLAAPDSETTAARYREQEELRHKAVALRQDGLSTTQIARELGIPVSSTLSGWLVGVQPPDWTRRPRAKDDVREKAREMRLAGATYPEIVEALGVSKSSVSLWVRDLPIPPKRPRPRDHARRMAATYWAAERQRRDDARAITKAAGASMAGQLSARELILVGAALYWAEGAKDKPWQRRERLALINSDERVVRTYLAWLHLLGVEPERLGFRVSIHESADVEAAQDFWSEVVGVPRERFYRPTLKRHRARTIRRNVGEDYHGCLVITAAKSRIEYQQMEGIFQAIAESAGRLLSGDDPGDAIGA